MAGMDTRPAVFVIPAFPLENVQLLKDRMVIPYAYYRHFGRSMTIVTKRVGEYPYLQTLAGARIDALQYDDDAALANFRSAVLTYLQAHIREMDVLFLFGFYAQYVPIVYLYKKLRPDGKIYLKLDANVAWMDRLPPRLEACRTLLDLCDVVSAESMKAQQYLCKKWGRRVDFVPNGFYSFGKDTPWADYAAKQNTILTVGRIGTAQKHNELMLDAFARAASRLPGWSLRLVGPIEPGFPAFMQQFFQRHPRLKARVTLTGPITDKARLAEEYRRAKVFTLSSRSEGGEPNVYSEAALRGCNIVVSSVDAAGDMTDEERRGIVFPIGDAAALADAWETLCRDETRMERGCREIQEYVRTYYDYDKIVERLDLLLRLS